VHNIKMGLRPIGQLCLYLTDLVYCRKHRWVDNIIMGLRPIGQLCLYLTDQVYCRNQWMDVVNAAINLRVPKSVGKFSNLWVCYTEMYFISPHYNTFFRLSGRKLDAINIRWYENVIGHVLIHRMVYICRMFSCKHISLRVIRYIAI
jgi:hypothetical protein